MTFVRIEQKEKDKSSEKTEKSKEKKEMEKEPKEKLNHRFEFYGGVKCYT